jgi:REP element-mobilizing transposase RayT
MPDYFMPDHVHLIAEGKEEASDLRKFIARAKHYSGYRYSQANGGRKLWQRYGYERVLRDNESAQTAVRYVLENPVRKGMVEHPREYAFIGSSTFELRELLEFAYSASVADHRE